MEAGDPDQRRRETDAELAAYADAARRRVDAFAEARIRRLRELSDRLIATAETVDRRFGEAAAIKEQLDDLVAALTAAAERAAQEAGAPWPGDPAPPAAEPPPRGAPGTGSVQVQDTGEPSPP